MTTKDEALRQALAQLEILTVNLGRGIYSKSMQKLQAKENQDVMSTLREALAQPDTLKAVADEYHAWIVFHDAGDGDYRDFIRKTQEDLWDVTYDN